MAKNQDKRSSKSANSSSKAKKEPKKKIKIPRTVQDSIPYETVYPNGIIKIANGKYCKSY